MQHNYRHIVLFGRGGKPGYATISFEWKKVADPKSYTGHSLEYKAGISFCSPKDHFNKKLGREQADARLKNSPIGSKSIPCSDGKYVIDSDFESVFSSVMRRAQKLAVGAEKGKLIPRPAKVKASKEKPIVVGVPAKSAAPTKSFVPNWAANAVRRGKVKLTTATSQKKIQASAEKKTQAAAISEVFI